ncbi:MAG: type II toxin-antitoxin system RelE/ParE family toxin [Candidatus Omnitrophota bacterium]|jgi:toxin ParE1/3/4|nr:MAG: type II toxin-antitoxin system RelE/ParE family toxin [Candidatus Omnitrophota bacterium]
MKYCVFIITDAEEDIFAIYNYIVSAESVEKAESVYQTIQSTCLSLSELPNRGHYPSELERLNIYEYREVHCYPFRIIYQVKQRDVYIHCVLDGRREIQELLEKRLLRSIV